MQTPQHHTKHKQNKHTNTQSKKQPNKFTVANKTNKQHKHARTQNKHEQKNKQL